MSHLRANLHPKYFSKKFIETINALLVDRQKSGGKPAELRLYSLRKSFKMNAARAGEKFVQFGMGHILKDNGESYFEPQRVEENRKFYDYAMPWLLRKLRTWSLGRLIKQWMKFDADCPSMKPRLGQ